MRATLTIGSFIAIALLCSALGVAGCYDSESQYGGESHFLRPCQKTVQCGDLGQEYACIAGHCQADADSGAKANSSGGAAGRAAVGSKRDVGNVSAGASGSAISDATPLVMLLIDTSGSMERKTRCNCSTPSCEECLPDCARGEHNRWAQTLEVLTGTFDEFSCEAMDRTEENGATYDVGYYLPHYRPAGTQRGDGLLDSYRDRLRFGVATFDGFETFAGARPLVPMTDFDFERSAETEGLWSYNPGRAIPGLRSSERTPSGSFRYPNTAEEYFIDTGIRSADAEEGALRVATDPARAGEINDAIQSSLFAVRPYGGTPIASSLDDLYYFLGQDPAMEDERSRAAPLHVVLITDGYPDDDYRSFGCNCADDDSPTDPKTFCGGPPNDPALMHCPYPTAEGAAHRLRCGLDLEHCDGPATQLHVIGFAIDDDVVATGLDAIAVAGGGQGAHFAASRLELRDALDAVLADIAQ